MIQLISFEKGQVDEVLNLLEIRTKLSQEQQTYLILKNKEEQAKCETCGKELTIDNLGNIAKGSEDFKKPHKLFCDNPACFAPQLSGDYKKASEDGA